MQERVTLPHAQINSDLLVTVLRTPMWYWIALGVLGALTLVGLGVFGVVMATGMGLTGLGRAVVWAVFISDFVYWVGIAHAGVMISALLRLSKAEWRRPITRAAEVVTVFALIWAALHPVIHAGRPWRVFYWVFPYDFPRGIWPDPRSPLVWDPAAITTYLTGTFLFVIVALVPDMAVIRDRTNGIKHQVYSFLAMGWRGTPRQWKLQVMAGFLLSALLLPVFVSVRSIIAWDFSVSIGVNGWHTTVMAPYFLMGAVHSGVAAVTIMMILMRRLFRWEAYIRIEHIENLAKLMIALGTGWLYFFLLEFGFSLYSLESADLALREMLVSTWPWNLLFYIMLIGVYFFPVPLWLFRSVRRSPMWMVITCLAVNVGMWIERFLVIVPSLARKQPLTFNWGTYHPTIYEITILIGGGAAVLFMLMLFAKLAPMIPIFDMKEGQVLSDNVQVGRKSVPALRVEE